MSLLFIAGDDGTLEAIHIPVFIDDPQHFCQ